MTEPGRDKYSESTLKLSERYGIDPARLDAILGKPKEVAPASAVEPTREWIEERRIHQPNVEAATARPKEPVKEPARDPVKIVDPAISTSAASTPTRKVKDVRLEGSSLASGARNEKTYTYQKQGTSPLTWIIGVVILGLFAIMFFAMRGCENKPAQQAQTPPTVIDTVVKTDTLATTDTVAVPVEAPAATPAKPATNRPRARRAATASSSTRNVALSTTSSFSAQEKLAELKADGNTKAKIQRVTKNGVTLYQVKTK